MDDTKQYALVLHLLRNLGGSHDATEATFSAADIATAEMKRDELIKQLDLAVYLLQQNKAAATPTTLDAIEAAVLKLRTHPEFVAAAATLLGITATQIVSALDSVDTVVATERTLIGGDTTEKAIKVLSALRSHPVLLSAIGVFL